jgi:hypothetical protein
MRGEPAQGAAFVRELQTSFVNNGRTFLLTVF